MTNEFSVGKTAQSKTYAQKYDIPYVEIRNTSLRNPLYNDYIFWRKMGLRAFGAYYCAKYGFFNYVIDIEYSDVGGAE